MLSTSLILPILIGLTIVQVRLEDATSDLGAAKIDVTKIKKQCNSLNYMTNQRADYNIDHGVDSLEGDLKCDNPKHYEIAVRKVNDTYTGFVSIAGSTELAVTGTTYEIFANLPNGGCAMLPIYVDFISKPMKVEVLEPCQSKKACPKKNACP